MSMLSAFSNQIVKFFEELSEVIPEEKDIKMATEAIKGAKKINPRLILDLFYEHIYIDLNDAITARDQPFIVEYGKKKIATQFNEIMPAITLFDRHWPTLSVSTQDAIWKYLKVLCVLCEKVKAEKK
uniref:Uncharacterized protein n=1 Tax=viral metagenome TaxID=1070528 RepID=A0A6C0ANP9_9ZZZZ